MTEVWVLKKIGHEEYWDGKQLNPIVGKAKTFGNYEDAFRELQIIKEVLDPNHEFYAIVSPHKQEGETWKCCEEK